MLLNRYTTVENSSLNIRKIFGEPVKFITNLEGQLASVTQDKRRSPLNNSKTKADNNTNALGSGSC